MPDADQRLASYAAALMAWKRSGMGSEWAPDAEAFGLTPEEAAKVERDGYDTSILPTPLRPAEGSDSDAEPRTLVLLSTSAAALAAAEVGEEVEVLVPDDGQTPEGTDSIQPDDVPGVFYACPEPDKLSAEGPLKMLAAPAAEGERVEVGCPKCKGDGFEEPPRPARLEPWGDPPGHVHRGGQCSDCRGFGTIPATVVSDPAPSRWCSGSQKDGDEWWHPPHGPDGDPENVRTCPTCQGDPPFAWRLTLRREATDG